MSVKQLDFTTATDDQLRHRVAVAAGFDVVPYKEASFIIKYPDGAGDNNVYFTPAAAWRTIDRKFIDMGICWRLFDLTNGSLTIKSDGITVEVAYRDRRFGLNLINATSYTPERALMVAYLSLREGES